MGKDFTYDRVDILLLIGSTGFVLKKWKLKLRASSAKKCSNISKGIANHRGGW